jgi:hypothetical protein
MSFHGVSGYRLDCAEPVIRDATVGAGWTSMVQDPAPLGIIWLNGGHSHRVYVRDDRPKQGE